MLSSTITPSLLHVEKDNFINKNTPFSGLYSCGNQAY